MIRIKPKLTLDNIHKIVSQEQIWQDLLHINIDKSFTLRDDDSNPSCRLWYGNSKDLLLSDLGDPNMQGITWYKYLMKTEYGETSHGFLSALEEIRQRYGLELTPYTKYDRTVLRKPVKKDFIKLTNNGPTIIQINYQKKGGKLYYSPKVLSYWGQYGITKEKLVEKRIYPLNSFWINGSQFKLPHKLVFGYYHGKNKYDNDAFSIYIPEGFNDSQGKKRKWLKNIDKSVIPNIECLDSKGKLLIIQTALKDTACLECLGYKNIVSLNAESMFFLKKDWEGLKSRFESQIYFANNDWHKVNNPGLGYAKIYEEKYNLPYIYVPDGTTSDISDYRAKYGEKKTLDLLETILSKFYEN